MMYLRKDVLELLYWDQTRTYTYSNTTIVYVILINPTQCTRWTHLWSRPVGNMVYPAG